MTNEKITLWDLLQHVLQQRHKYIELHIFDLGESTSGGAGSRAAWCKLVADELTDEIRQTVTKMQEVSLCVLGRKLSVTVYTKIETIRQIDPEVDPG